MAKSIKSKIPKAVKVFGKMYKIQFANDLNARGEFDDSEALIKLDANLKSDELMVTLIHELVHAIFNRTGVHQGVYEGLEEVIAEVIAQFMTETFKLEFK